LYCFVSAFYRSFAFGDDDYVDFAEDFVEGFRLEATAEREELVKQAVNRAVLEVLLLC